mgnify:CR=1 FL=1
MKTLKLLILFVSIAYSVSAYAENEKALLNRLKKAEGTEKLHILNKLTQMFESTQPEKSIEYAEKALKTARKENNRKEEARLLNYLGNIYYKIKDYKKSAKTYEDEFKIWEELNNKKRMVNSAFNIAVSYKKNGNPRKAARHYEQSLEIAKKINDQEKVLYNYDALAEINAEIGRHEEAYTYYRKYMELSFTYYKMRKHRQISIMEEQFEQEKEQKEKVIKEKEKKLEKAKKKEDALIKTTKRKDKTIIKQGKEITLLQLKEQKRQKFIILLIGITMLILLLTFFLYSRYRTKKKHNSVLELRNVEISQQKEEIEAQRDEIQKQRDIATEQRQEILDSIHYASRIQSAILPLKIFMGEVLREYFILFKPRDVVSGDFYWITKKDNRIYIAAADCTGHGVPGAFMSMLGIASLKEIINKGLGYHAHEILNHLRENIIRALHQTGKSGEAQDGMDMSLCILDQDTRKMEFSGANNPVYIFRNKEIKEIKGNKMPIGIHPSKEDSFTLFEEQMNPGETFYLFSDGYADQFGGPKGKKFKYKTFKNLLMDIYEKPMDDQKEILDKTIEEWRRGFEQIDDILVIGVKIL